MQITTPPMSFRKIHFGSANPFQGAIAAVVQDLQSYFGAHPQLSPAERARIVVTPDDVRPPKNKVRVSIIMPDWSDMSLSTKVSQLLQQHPQLKNAAHPNAVTPDTFTHGATTVQMILCAPPEENPLPAPVRQSQPITP